MELWFSYSIQKSSVCSLTDRLFFYIDWERNTATTCAMPLSDLTNSNSLIGKPGESIGSLFSDLVKRPLFQTNCDVFISLLMSYDVHTNDIYLKWNLVFLISNQDKRLLWGSLTIKDAWMCLDIQAPVFLSPRSPWIRTENIWQEVIILYDWVVLFFKLYFGFSFVTGKSRKTARNSYTFPPNLY